MRTLYIWFTHRQSWILTAGGYKYALSTVYAKPVCFLPYPLFCMYGLCIDYLQFLPIYNTTITCGRNPNAAGTKEAVPCSTETNSRKAT